MAHFLNTIAQIKGSDSVGLIAGISKHLKWQLRKAFRLFPCELRISRSVMAVDQPGGVAALVNAMGEYDFNNMQLLRLLLSKGNRTFVDVGANIGSYSLIASETANAKVVSIEPHPRTFGALVENIRKNKRQNVTCLNLAISRQESVLELTDLRESSINRIISSREAPVPTMRVQAKPFHAICKELGIAPDFIKIDVEGHEREVLDGFGEWESPAKIIFIEGGEGASVRGWMYRAGFEGPYFFQFKRYQLGAEKQARLEDPIYVHKSFLPQLQSFGIRIGPPLLEGNRRNSQARSVGAVSETRPPQTKRIPVKAILLTNCVTPYALPVWQKLTSSLMSLRLLLSTPMETDRHWERNWDGLDVKVQKSLYTRRTRRHEQGFTVTDHLHFPYDSLFLLFSYSPDVVISAQLGFRTLQAALFRIVRRRSRLVILVEGSEHTEKGISRIRTQWRQTLLRAADAVVAIGASGARYLERIGVPSSKIIQAPQATDPTSFYQIPLRKGGEEAKRLLYVGRLIEGKGLEYFIKELSDWLKENPGKTCELWMVGDGPLRSKLQPLPISRGLEMKFFGNIPYHQLPKYYGQADVCIVPTLADTWGLVVNEALASGVPVLGSLYSQAVDELIEDGVNGWRFYPDRGGSVRSALGRIFHLKEAEADAMRAAARKSIRHLTPEFAAQCFVRAIRLALDGVRMKENTRHDGGQSE